MLIGVLLRIQHWAYGLEILLASKLIFALFFILVLIEIFRSRKAAAIQKYTWGLIFSATGGSVLLLFGGLLLLFAVALLANLYFHFARKYFVYTRAELESIRFDSI